jgi:hypothetical protein
MPWNAPIPPATRANATPQQDSHPSDHNQLSAALTQLRAMIDQRSDLQNFIGASWTGGMTVYRFGTVGVIRISATNPGVLSPVNWNPCNFSDNRLFPVSTVRFAAVVTAGGTDAVAQIIYSSSGVVTIPRSFTNLTAIYAAAAISLPD